MAGPGIGARTGKELSELIKDAESRLIEANRLTQWRSRRHPRASRLVRFVDGPVLEWRQGWLRPHARGCSGFGTWAGVVCSTNAEHLYVASGTDHPDPMICLTSASAESPL